MDHIASQQPGAFAKYIKLYKNTIQTSGNNFFDREK